MGAMLALEMIHAYSLIHDDLPAMDNDDLRRGKPTVHKKFGEALAILAGDALLTGAFEVLVQSQKDANLAVVMISELARAAGGSGMIAGQVWDLHAEKSGETSLEIWTEIHDAKTGALFGAALAMGSAEALGGEVMDLDQRRDWGIKLGRLFQIVDDRLDRGPFFRSLGDERLSALCQRSADDLEVKGKVYWPSQVETLQDILKFFVLRSE